MGSNSQEACLDAPYCGIFVCREEKSRIAVLLNRSSRRRFTDGRFAVSGLDTVNAGRSPGAYAPYAR